MSRLTDLNQALRRQSSRTLWIPELATPTGALGQCLARNDAVRETRHTAAEAVGSTSAIRGLLDVLVQPVIRAIKRRRTARALKQLDAHLLADIGVERHRIDEFVAELVNETAPGASSRVAPRVGHRIRPRFSLLAALRKSWRRQAAIAALRSLSDRSLADIGIERGRIPEAVDGLLARDAATAVLRPEPNVAPLPTAPMRSAVPAHQAAA